MGKAREKKTAVVVSVVIEPNDGGYLASVPGVQGAFAEGETMEEAIFNCIDVLKMIIAYRTERGESIALNTIALDPTTRMTIAVPVELG
ncbi:MAG: hypothetical protein D6723_15175 [Acidobacteria bacterium]|nr:MAG: hypothetical protein D6723_15175 [Acidobacteriota bacterium]